MIILTKIFFALILVFFSPLEKPKNILKLKSKPHFSETISCTRTHDHNFQINIDVSYNKNNSVDEEYSYNLQLIFPENIEEGKVFKIDSANKDIKCNYQFSSVWYWPSSIRPNNMIGIIKISEKTKKSLVIDIDVITDKKNEERNVFYRGKRTVYP